VEDAEGVLTEGSVGVAVFKGLVLSLVFMALGLLLRGQQFESVVVVQVPCRWGQVPVEGWAVNVVEAVSAIRWGS